MKLIALALLTLPLFSQSQSKLAPDCTQGNIVFTGTASWQSFDNRPQSNNTGIPCAFWSLTYVAQSSVTAITIEIDGSPDNSTWTALATSSLIPSGRLEWNGQVSSVATYYPWIRVKVTYGSGSGTINAVLNGWRANGVTIGGGTGGGGSGSPNSATAFTSATSVLIPGAGTPNVIVECYDNSTPAKFKIQTNSESVSNTSPYNYTVTFASNQSGVCILNSSGGSASGAQVQAGAQYSMATYPDAGTNPVVGPLAPGGAVLGPVGILQSGGNAGAIGVVGNTGYPTLQTNAAYFMAPPSASFTSYALQVADRAASHWTDHRRRRRHSHHGRNLCIGRNKLYQWQPGSHIFRRRRDDECNWHDHGIRHRPGWVNHDHVSRRGLHFRANDGPSDDLHRYDDDHRLGHCRGESNHFRHANRNRNAICRISSPHLHWPG